MTSDLVLYQSEDCPYCAKVRSFCSANGISLTIHNPRTPGSPVTGGRVTDDKRYEELQEHGKDQIPLLVDEERDEAIYESGDIIAYLGEHYVDGEPVGAGSMTTTKNIATGVLLLAGMLASIDVVTGTELLNRTLGVMGLMAATLYAVAVGRERVLPTIRQQL
jgi:hypothetical protein